MATKVVLQHEPGGDPPEKTVEEAPAMISHKIDRKRGRFITLTDHETGKQIGIEADQIKTFEEV